MKKVMTFICCVVAVFTPIWGAENPRPYLRIFLSAQQEGPQEGIHDRQKIVDDMWRRLVARGAVTSAGIVFPMPIHFATHDVVVFYGPKVWPERDTFQSALRSFLIRGGGLVILHHAIEDNGIQHISTWTGLPWQKDKSEWIEGEWKIKIVQDPITYGMEEFVVKDYIVKNINLSNTDKVLAWAAAYNCESNERFPVVWTREVDSQRTVFFVLGHYYSTLVNDAVEELLVRLIAWAAKREIDYLLSDQEKQRYYVNPLRKN